MIIQRILVWHRKLATFHQYRYRHNLNILFFGTDNFSFSSLKKLHQENLSRLEVVTSLKAMHNPIKVFAESNSLKIYDWMVLSKEENFKVCQEFDLGVVVSFGHLIPEHIINCFSSGMINVHASLLPKYRGAAPIIHAIRNGDKCTGVSIMRIRPKAFDVGEVLTTKQVPIPENILMPTLHELLSRIGAELLIECIQDLNRYEPIKQDDSVASYAPKITNEFCEVRWNKMGSTEIFNLYRSLYSLKPIRTSFKKEIVKIFEVLTLDGFQPTPQLRDSLAGTLWYSKTAKLLCVKCADANFLGIKQLSIGKKKAMSGAEFQNGFLKDCKTEEMFFE